MEPVKVCAKQPSRIEPMILSASHIQGTIKFPLLNNRRYFIFYIEIDTPKQMTKEELATAILTRKLTPNSLLVDDSIVDDHSTISLSAAKMDELGLFNGDTVLLKGKKRKNTVAIVNAENGVSDNRVRMTKVVRSNLRYYPDSF